MRPVEIKITKIYLKEEYFNKKKTMQEIAKSIGCGLVTIRRNLLKYNIRIRTISEVTKGKLNPLYIKNDVRCPICKKIFHVKPRRTRIAKVVCCSRKCASIRSTSYRL